MSPPHLRERLEDCADWRNQRRWLTAAATALVIVTAALLVCLVHGREVF